MTFDWTFLLGNLISALIIISGWIVAYKLNSRKDLNNKKREIRTTFLIEAYRIIAFSANRDNNQEEKKRFEAAIEQVQFLGTKNQINLLDSAIKTSNFTPLLEAMRDEIRSDLNIEAVNVEIKHFRFNK